MSRRRGLFLPLLTTLLACCLVGCGAERVQPRTVAVAPVPPSVDVRVLRRITRVAYPAPARLRRWGSTTSVALAGTVLTWSTGPSLIDHGRRRETAILVLRVTRVGRGEGDVREGRAYLRISRPTQLTTRALARAIPAGVRVIAYADPVAGRRPGTVDYVLNPAAGLPDGARSLVPAPDGLIVERGPRTGFGAVWARCCG